MLKKYPKDPLDDLGEMKRKMACDMIKYYIHLPRIQGFQIYHWYFTKFFMNERK